MAPLRSPAIWQQKNLMPQYDDDGRCFSIWRTVKNLTLEHNTKSWECLNFFNIGTLTFSNSDTSLSDRDRVCSGQRKNYDTFFLRSYLQIISGHGEEFFCTRFHSVLIFYSCYEASQRRITSHLWLQSTQQTCAFLKSLHMTKNLYREPEVHNVGAKEWVCVVWSKQMYFKPLFAMQIKCKVYLRPYHCAIIFNLPWSGTIMLLRFIHADTIYAASDFESKFCHFDTSMTVRKLHSNTCFTHWVSHWTDRGHHRVHFLPATTQFDRLLIYGP